MSFVPVSVLILVLEISCIAGLRRVVLQWYLISILAVNTFPDMLRWLKVT